LVLEVLAQAIDKLFNGLGLVTSRPEVGHNFEIGHGLLPVERKFGRVL
jgi:hypothetical protein